MFGLFKTREEDEKVGPNGHYEGEILCADYAAGDSDHHDMWPHGKGKMTVTLEDGTVEVYEGSSHFFNNILVRKALRLFGRRHQAKLTSIFSGK